MFQLDDNFLNDLGLGGLPDDQKKAFLQHTYDELQLQVGTKLSEGLDEMQLQQFEHFVDAGDAERTQEVREAAFVHVLAWFEKHLADYQSRADFLQLKQSAPEGVDQMTIVSEYGSLKWLEMNRPDYRQIVTAELEKLKQQIIANRDGILGSIG